jgi:hypothetical protein
VTSVSCIVRKFRQKCMRICSVIGSSDKCRLLMAVGLFIRWQRCIASILSGVTSNSRSDRLPIARNRIFIFKFECFCHDVWAQCFEERAFVVRTTKMVRTGRWGATRSWRCVHPCHLGRLQTPRPHCSIVSAAPLSPWWKESLFRGAKSANFLVAIVFHR